MLSVPRRVGAVLDGQPVSLLLLSFGSGTLSSPVRTLLPVYVESTLHQPPAFTATLLTVQLAVTGVFSLVGGAVADTLGQRRANLLGLLSVPLAPTIFLPQSLWALVLVVLALGITGALQNVGGSYLMASATRLRLAQMSALHRIGGTFGGALGTMIVGPAAQRWGFARAGVTDLALGLVFLAGSGRLLPEAPAGVRTSRGALGRVLASYVGVLGQRPVALLGTLRYCTTCLYGALPLAVPLLVYRLSGSSVTVASAYATVALVAASLFQYMMGQRIDRLGPARPLRFLTALVLLLAVLLAVFVHSLAGLVILGACANCALWALSTSMPTLVRAVATSPAAGRAYGANEMLWSAGMLSGTVLAGALVNAHAHLLFALLAVVNLGAVAATRALSPWLASRPAGP